MVNAKKIDHIKKGKPFSLLDVVAICLSLVVCVSLVAYSCTSRSVGDRVVIYRAYENISEEYSLKTDRVIEIECTNGAEGLFVVVIKGGAAHVRQSPCKGQDCVHMHEIKHDGQKIICAQTRISISIKSSDGIIAVI